MKTPNFKERLTGHLSSLLTTHGVLEDALMKNPKLIREIERVIARVKATLDGSVTRTEDGQVMDATDPAAGPVRFLALKRQADAAARDESMDPGILRDAIDGRR